jgi:hypothetical protein
MDVISMVFTPRAELGASGTWKETFWFFEAEYAVEVARPTPLWDLLLGTQLSPVEGEEKKDDGIDERPAEIDSMSAVECLEMLIGRLFHKVGRFDQFQVMPFIRGDANCGKSSVVNLVAKMFPAKRVAVLAANHEKTFGLQTWVDARVILAPDIPQKMHKVLSQTIWQRMVTGEGLSAPRKNKDALDIESWPVPQFWAGNHPPSFSDNAGSASRRMAVFRFQTLIASRDTSLMAKIMGEELVSVMLHCLQRYHDVRLKHAGRDFWAFAPAVLRETRDDAAEETNYLAEFVNNGDDYYDVVFEEGQITPLLDLKKAFANHMKFSNPDVEWRWQSDYHPI